MSVTLQVGMASAARIGPRDGTRELEGGGAGFVVLVLEQARKEKKGKSDKREKCVVLVPRTRTQWIRIVPSEPAVLRRRPVPMEVHSQIALLNLSLLCRQN